ncbi:PPW family C-terminal domain-containing PPE protein, partial [Mycobacterium tuberculosis]|uniref:PPW family C-terminal domain-containing PPE protein n=1 Tax=Mycobacterium tuberculosis TaxID=1773 RepID=UPI0023DFD8E3
VGAVAIVDALRILLSNPAVWEKTALIVNYDENGGFFDHVVPPPPPPVTAPPPVTGAGIQSFGYLVGDLNSAAQARKAVGTGVRKKTPEPDSAEAPAAAAAPEEQVQPQRRRRPKIKQLGRGYEYLDLDPETGHDPTGSPQGAGTLGFAGTTHKASPGQVAGLITLPNDAFGGSPRTPMMPGTWDTDSATRVE